MIRLLKVLLIVCVTILSLSLLFIVKLSDSIDSNDVFLGVTVLIILSGLGALVISVILGIASPKNEAEHIQIYKFAALDKNGSKSKGLAVFEILENQKTQLRIDVNEDSFSAIEANLFEALIAIREQTDQVGIKLLIQGSRPEYWPSGLSLQMSNGLQGYIHEMKTKQYLDSDIVGIFDGTSKNNVGTLKEHKDYQNEWTKMINNSH